MVLLTFERTDNHLRYTHYTEIYHACSASVRMFDKCCGILGKRDSYYIRTSPENKHQIT